MKPLKPGQLCTINNKVYRAKKRPNPLSCHGCCLDDFVLCPNIVDIRFEKPPIPCDVHGIILERVKNKDYKFP